MNYNLNLNLKKLESAFLLDIKGKTETKQCICIPIKDNNLYVGEKGVYLSALIREIREENRKNNTTHIITKNIPTEEYQKLSEEEKMQIPILGNITTIPQKEMKSEGTVNAEDNDDLPF